MIAIIIVLSLSFLYVFPIVVLHLLLRFKHYSIESEKSDDNESNSALDILVEKPFVLVHAHADDESMFFLPTLLTLREQTPATIYEKSIVVCLTSSPLIRAEEYCKCGREVLGLPSSQIHILHCTEDKADDEENLEVVKKHLGSSLHVIEEDQNGISIHDGFQYHYDKQVVVDALEHILPQSFDWNEYNFITFDDYGVSGHPNHIDVSFGVRELCLNHSSAVFTLDSVSLIVKYTPALFAIRFLLSSNTNERAKICSRKASRTLLYALTKVYQSQLTWYRCCFALISMYGYCNTLHLVNNKK